MADPPLKRDVPGYAYYRGSGAQQKLQNKEGARKLSQALLYPKLRDPNFIVLRKRRRLFSQFAQGLPEHELTVLDLGGRLQPFRALIEDRLRFYVAIDPVLEGLLDVVAVGEKIPFQDESFELVICTQVLCYVSEPSQVISEIHRVLKKMVHSF